MTQSFNTIADLRAFKHANKKLRKNDIETSYERPQRIVKHHKNNKWQDNHFAKKQRKHDIVNSRMTKYADRTEFKHIVVPELFNSFWPPSFEDLVRCKIVMPPIFEGSLKDEFLWWLKTQ